MHATVADYMTREPRTIGPRTSLAFAQSLMHEGAIRHLPVVEGGALVGLLSERDIYFADSFKEARLDEVEVVEAMTIEPYVVAPTEPLDAVARTMSEQRYGTAVVVEGGRVVGLFTTTDALRALADAS